MLEMYRHEDEKCEGVVKSVLPEEPPSFASGKPESQSTFPREAEPGWGHQQLPHVRGRGPESRIRTWEWGAGAPPL